ncbi:MAG: cytochrome c biogenesis protein CcsA [Verrucomicrobiota bacterium]
MILSNTNGFESTERARKLRLRECRDAASACIKALWLLIAVSCLEFTPALHAEEVSREDALKAFAAVPVLEHGRYKPWDSVARNSLLMIYEKQKFRYNGEKWEAVEWLGEVLFDGSKSDQRQIFRVMHPDVRMLLGNEDETQKYYSFNEILKNLPKLAEQADQAAKLDVQLRDPYQKAVVRLSRNVTLYQNLKHTLDPPGSGTLRNELNHFAEWSGEPLAAFQAHQGGQEHDVEALQQFLRTASVYKRLSELTHCRPIPTNDTTGTEDWMGLWDTLVKEAHSGELPLAVEYYAELSDRYQQGEWQAFVETCEKLIAELQTHRAEAISTASLETMFNRSEVFYRTAVLYVVIFLIVMVSWLKLSWQVPLGRLALWLVTIAVVLHTAGLILRVVIQDRPPVTNLYSSALLVGWGAVVLGLVMERLYKNGIGAAAASMVGFKSLLVAHNLAGDGDTMTMMQAVLDSNFWLATHVIVIILGYSATFFAGFLAIMYIFFGFFTKLLTAERAKALDGMVYGIICFALLFSFVGTVLGGIWADQSWGRFWGWDPKENGALLIVLWNAIILHCRWGKFMGTQGTMIAAVFGNIVTVWSWFGTNMLGVGLHSYGFMEKAFFWLMAFGFFMLMIMAIGTIPTRLWDSFITQKKLAKKG